MMFTASEKQGPGLECSSDTDTEDEEDSEDEDDEDISGTTTDRLASQYEASIKEVLDLALQNPKVDALKELREELWLLRQAAQLNMEAAEGKIQFDFEFSASKPDFDQK